MPRIGLLSDPHGQAETTAAAVALLLAGGAEMLICLGDVGSEAVLDRLMTGARGEVHGGGAGGSGGAGALAGPMAPDHQLPVRLVFGNVDFDLAGLSRHAAALALTVDHPVGRLPTERGDLVFMHGHDAEAFAAALAERPAYLCVGHTHRPADHRSGPTRIINPGALYRAARHTVALLDTRADTLQLLTVAGQ